VQQQLLAMIIANVGEHNRDKAQYNCDKATQSRTKAAVVSECTVSEQALLAYFSHCAV
jgi:hypothetical protein